MRWQKIKTLPWVIVQESTENRIQAPRFDAYNMCATDEIYINTLSKLLTTNIN